MNAPAEDRVLRAKYLDWCSAKIADRFLELTADQIYELAHTTPGPHSDGAGRSVAAQSGLGVAVKTDIGDDEAVENDSVPAASSHLESERHETVPDEESVPRTHSGLGYRTLVEQVTEVLATTLRLPSFGDWTTAYREAPERFEAELVGFWREGGELDRRELTRGYGPSGRATRSRRPR